MDGLWIITVFVSIVLMDVFETSTVTITMPKVKPEGADSYLCSSFRTKDVFKSSEGNASYVTEFQALASADRAHHLLLMMCNQPPKTEEGLYWDCRHHEVCRDPTSLVFAWAKNAEATVLPDNVGFKVDQKQFQYLILQVHYVNPTPDPDTSGLRIKYQTEKTKYTAGIFLMMRSYLHIPPHTAAVHGDMNCLIRGSDNIYPFAFRTHAHTWGSVITGYKYSTNTKTFTEFARGNPQWPQAFYPVNHNVTISPEDYLVARCTYNTTANDKSVQIGATSGDEMCNLYVMYYSENPKAGYRQCINEESKTITQNIPKDSDVPLPPNLELEEHAKHVQGGTTEGRKKGDLKATNENDQEYFVKEINMPGAVPNRVDDYRCVAYPARSFFTDNSTDQIYITGFLAAAKAEKAHHVILSHCTDPRANDGSIFQCMHHGMCRQSSRIAYAWAKDAPATNLPPDVGFTIHKDEYLVLQVHYKHPLDNPDYTGLRLRMTHKKPKFTAGMLLLLRSHLTIPPRTKSIYGDVNCAIQAQNPLHFFAFRTHAHDLGKVISGYIFRHRSDGSFLNPPEEIARGDPQKPQTFYSMDSIVEVKPDDVVAARCEFDSSNSSSFTKIGFTAGDEMCNLYLMYYSKTSNDDFRICADEESPNFVIPSETNQDHLLSKRSSNVDGRQLPGPVYGSSIGLPYPVYHVPPVYAQPVYVPPPPPPPIYPYNTNYYNTNYNLPDYTVDNDNVNDDNVDDLKETETTTIFSTTTKRRKSTSTKKGKNLPDSGLHPVPNWPPNETKERLGQISGVSIDVYGNPVVFHRGDRTWNVGSFKFNNEYNGDRNDPIHQKTILTLNSTGHIINAWGDNMFFMPHMITIDAQNNVWVTDVALHQIMKFAPYGGKGDVKTPLIELGKKFEPGSDKVHFCKPTAVAVSKDGKTFFVADGYCNSRIIKYRVRVDSSGYHRVNVEAMLHWGQANGAGFTNSRDPYAFNIPHGLTLAEDKGLVCVADRENGRVQCFNSEDGLFVRSFKSSEFGSTIYSVAYTPSKGGQLLALGGAESFSILTGKRPQIYVMNIDDDESRVVATIGVNVLKNPHDLAVSEDGNEVYTVELNPYVITKFTTGQIRTPISSFPLSPSIPSTVDSPLSSFTDSAGKTIQQHFEKLGNYIPTSGLTVGISIASVVFTILISFCVACRKCRKRGKGTMNRGGNGHGTKRNRDGKKLNLGDLLGRSKEGFQRLKTDDDDADADLSSEDSDLEDFSVPALNA